MIELLSIHKGTIIVGLIVAGIAASIAAKLIRDKREGKSLGCDCGSGGCLFSSNCCLKR